MTSVRDGKIKRPMNSFMLYRRDKQHEIAQKHPGINYREVNRIVGELWRAESKEIKEIYSRMALDGQLAHKEKYPDYKYPSSVAKKNKRMISTGADAISVFPDLGRNDHYRAQPYSRVCGIQDKILKKEHASLIRLNTSNLGHTGAIPNSPKDRNFGITNTLLSPIAFSFDRDPILNAFLNSWDYSEYAQSSADRNKKNFIESSLAAHLPEHGYSANL